MARKIPGGRHGRSGRIMALILILILATVLIVPDQAYSRTSDKIVKGSAFLSSITLNFPEGGGSDPSLSLYLPGPGPVTRAKMNLRPVPGSDHPDRVYVDIGFDGREEWAFGGGIEGSFGRQNVFSNGELTQRLSVSSEGTLVSFFIPISMEISRGSLGLIPLPQPDGIYHKTLNAGPLSAPDPEILDVGDVDGDGNEDVVFYSEGSSTIMMYHVNVTGGYTGTDLVDINGTVVSLRVVPAGDDNAGFIAYTVEDGVSGSSEVSILTFREGNTSSHIVGSGLTANSTGFSLEKEDGSYRMYSLDGNLGRIVEVFVSAAGSVSTKEVLDLSIPSSGLGQGDLDGDGLRDLIIFPLKGRSENITLLRGSSEGGFAPADTNLTASLRAAPLGLDADGDGTDEIYFMAGQPASLSVLCMSQEGFNSHVIVFNGTVGSLRTTPDYNDMYAGPEELLYMSSPDGVYHIVPETGPGGNYHISPSPSLQGPAILGSFGENGKGSAYRVSSGQGISLYDLIWAGPRDIEVREAGGAGSIRGRLETSSLLKMNIGELGLMDGNRAQYTDDHGNVLVRCDLVLSAQSGLISARSLHVTYDGSFDVSSSADFLLSVSSAYKIFGEKVPFLIGSDSIGSVEVGPVEVTYDSPPVIDKATLQELHIDEGSLDMPLLYLWELIEDDYLQSWDLGISLIPIEEHAQKVLYIHEGVLRANMQAFPDLTGDLHFRLSVSDGRNKVVTDVITLVIDPVQDKPRPLSPPEGLMVLEGEKKVINLSGLFVDVDGDDIHFAYQVLHTEPTSLEGYLDVLMEGNMLTLHPGIKGKGGVICVRISAWDDHHGPDDPVYLDLCVMVEDVDSAPFLGQNPGPIMMSEDQDNPTRISMNGWFLDPDTPLSDYSISLISLSDSLDVSTVTFNGELYLVMYPKKDFEGTAYLQVQMLHKSNEITDWLKVIVEGENDPPELQFEVKSMVEEAGWEVTGTVNDVDSHAGSVEYRIDGSGWMKAEGWYQWSIYVPFDVIPPYGGYLFIKADDGEGTSEMKMVRMVVPEDYRLERSDIDGDGIPDIMDAFPYDPYEWVDSDGDGIGDNADAFPYNCEEWADTDGDGVGDNSDFDPHDPGIRYSSDTIFSPNDEPSVEDDGGFPVGALILGLGLSGLIAFILFTEIGMVLISTLGVNIYSKLSKKDILNHEVRGLIRGYIIANPGDHYSSIRRNLDLNNGTLAYHLRVLEQNNYIKSFFDGIFKRYYPSNVNIQKVQRNISKQEEIFNIILDLPGVTMEEIGTRIGVSRQVVNYHVKNLVRAGLITYSRDRKSSRFYPAEDDLEGLQKKRLKGEV